MNCIRPVMDLNAAYLMYYFDPLNHRYFGPCHGPFWPSMLASKKSQRIFEVWPEVAYLSGKRFQLSNAFLTLKLPTQRYLVPVPGGWPLYPQFLHGAESLFIPLTVKGKRDLISVHHEHLPYCAHSPYLYSAFSSLSTFVSDSFSDRSNRSR